MPEEGERQRLANVIRQWNNNRLDLFEISQPDKNLEFHGVIRFYFEDHIAGNVATKCLRICSSSSTLDVIQTLSEKFRPDMKMLTTCYSLYEVHTTEERKLDLNEKPLEVQLNWKSDNREGRFVLRSDKDILQENHEKKEKGGMIQNFKRTLSRKEKKKEKNKAKPCDKAVGDVNGSNCISASNSATKMSGSKKQERRQSDPGRPTYYEQPGLPVAIKFRDDCEEGFLSAVINYTNSSTVHFKLSPAYVLYAAGRFALQHHHSQGSHPSEQTHRVTSITNKMVDMTEKVIQKQQMIAGALAFWMANSSELLNFFRQDKDLSPLTQQAQVDLSHLVHKTYKCLMRCLQNELRKHLPTFLIDPEQQGPLPAGIEMVLNTLMNTMSLLRRCRVNPALTIQLFSQLFHYISAWLFNQLMGPEACSLGLRSHYWGATLRQRLTAIEAWAERQGLELAADCHLGHIIQATTLLTMNKYSVEDVQDILNTCFKLNSLQLQTLLSSYLYAANEPHIPPGLIESVVAAAVTSADELVERERRDLPLEESLDLHLPFLLPEGGYSCESLRGLPPGFTQFLQPICCKGLCSLAVQQNFKGSWTVFFTDTTSSAGTTSLAASIEPEVVTFTLKKPLNSGMGMSIVAAKGAGQSNLGIYVKSIVKGGPAEMDGRLTAGDQLLCVDGHSLVDLTQERAAGIIMQTGPVVTLQVAKLGACYHGLEALLSEPSPGEDNHSHAKPNGKALILYNGVDGNPSELWENHHETSRRQKEQMMQRNRQLYRSNPNMTNIVPEDREEPCDPIVRASQISAASTINLCTDTYQREYLTLPACRSQDKKAPEYKQPLPMFKVSLTPLNGHCTIKKTHMRQALSQENLCMDSGGPLVDKRHHQDQRTSQVYFPLRSSVSSHDILSDYNSPSKHQQQLGERKTGVGLWRTPLSQSLSLAPSIQPIRIDIPVTRPVNAQLNPSLATFKQNSSSLAVKLTQSVKENKQSQCSKTHSSQFQVNHVSYACPTSVTTKLPQQSLPSQHQQPIPHKEQVLKPQMTITPTKHVSFQKLPTQHNLGIPSKPKEPQYFTMSEEFSNSNSLSPDPWQRDAQEKKEKQRQLQVMDLLEHEVQDLQAKASRTPEESDRLRKLSLEWQFQKRLQEFQQSRDDDDEENDDMEVMMTIQQLEWRAESKGPCRQQNNEIKELKKQARANILQEENNITSEQRSTRRGDFNNMTSKENQEENMGRGLAPENLSFKDRQRLFSSSQLPQ